MNIQPKKDSEGHKQQLQQMQGILNWTQALLLNRGNDLARIRREKEAAELKITAVEDDIVQLQLENSRIQVELQAELQAELQTEQEKSATLAGKNSKFRARVQYYEQAHLRLIDHIKKLSIAKETLCHENVENYLKDQAAELNDKLAAECKRYEELNKMFKDGQTQQFRDRACITRLESKIEELDSEKTFMIDLLRVSRTHMEGLGEERRNIIKMNTDLLNQVERLTASNESLRAKVVEMYTMPMIFSTSRIGDKQDLQGQLNTGDAHGAAEGQHDSNPAGQHVRRQDGELEESEEEDMVSLLRRCRPHSVVNKGADVRDAVVESAKAGEGAGEDAGEDAGGKDDVADGEQGLFLGVTPDSILSAVPANTSGDGDLYGVSDDDS